MGVHPISNDGVPESGTQAISFYCDNIEATVGETPISPFRKKELGDADFGCACTRFPQGEGRRWASASGRGGSSGCDYAGDRWIAGLVRGAQVGTMAVYAEFGVYASAIDYSQSVAGYRGLH